MEHQAIIKHQQTKTIKPGQSNIKKAGEGEKRTHKEEKIVTVDSLEADLNIPQELKEIIEDSDDDMPLRFKDHNELMEIFSTLEEQNLFLIQRC